MKSKQKGSSSQAAARLKEEGNQHFLKGQFKKAVGSYTKAIERASGRPKELSVYYCNRSIANCRLQNFRSALSDADEAVRLDPANPKGYYRRASALAMLGKLEAAIDELGKTLAAAPPALHEEIQRKLKALVQLGKERAFLTCLVRSDELDLLDESTMEVGPDYTGPTLDATTALSPSFVSELLAYLKDGGRLHKRFLWTLLKRVKRLFADEPNIVDLTVDGKKMRQLTVCGDIHGQFYDLLNIFDINGLPEARRPYLFNGDIVDRGSFSVECVIALFAIKLMDPRGLFINRGNHESADLNKTYGFEGEVVAKYCPRTFRLIHQVFEALPLGHVVNRKVLVLHGGLFEREGVKLADLQEINRRQPVPQEGLMCDMLWADPSPLPGRQPSERGLSVQFGPDVAKSFLDDNGLGPLTRTADPLAPGHGGRVRGGEGRPRGDCVLGAELLRLRGQQGRVRGPRARLEAALRLL